MSSVVLDLGMYASRALKDVDVTISFRVQCLRCNSSYSVPFSVELCHVAISING